MQFKSAFLDKASGSYGGVTASHNRYGQYFRQRSTPVNPDSARQQTVRSIFAAVAVLWSSTLTQAQRDAWNLYGNTVDMINRVGDTIHLSGFNHYIRSNSLRLRMLEPRVDAGPTTLTLPATDPQIAATVSEAAQTISVVFDDTMDWCGTDDAFMSIQMSSPKGSGVTFIDGPLRIASYLEGDTAVPITSPQVIAVPFGVAEDQVGLIQARISLADGRLSTPFRDTFAVVA